MAHARNADARRSRANGFVLKAALGVDGCTNRLCRDVYPLLSTRIGAYYRFLRYLAVGLHLGFLSSHPDDNLVIDMPLVRPYEPNVDRFWKLVVGLEARGIVPIKRFDLWASILIGYSMWGATGEVEDPFQPDRDTDWDGWMHGVLLGWGFGLDFFFHKNMAVGAEFYFYKSWFLEYCNDVLGYTTCRDTSEFQRLDIGLWWSVAFVFTAWFGA